MWAGEVPLVKVLVGFFVWPIMLALDQPDPEARTEQLLIDAQEALTRAERNKQERDTERDHKEFLKEEAILRTQRLKAAQQEAEEYPF